jgi:hypothetical protein
MALFGGIMCLYLIINLYGIYNKLRRFINKPQTSHKPINCLNGSINMADRGKRGLWITNLVINLSHTLRGAIMRRRKRFIGLLKTIYINIYE